MTNTFFSHFLEDATWRKDHARNLLPAMASVIYDFAHGTLLPFTAGPWIDYSTFRFRSKHSTALSSHTHVSETGNLNVREPE